MRNFPKYDSYETAKKTQAIENRPSAFSILDREQKRNQGTNRVAYRYPYRLPGSGSIIARHDEKTYNCQNEPSRSIRACLPLKDRNVIQNKGRKFQNTGQYPYYLFRRVWHKSDIKWYFLQDTFSRVRQSSLQRR